MGITIQQPPTPFVGINAPELVNGKLWWDTDDTTPIQTPGYRTYVIKTSGYPATTADDVIICNNATSIAITLPVATGSGKVFSIKNINTGNATVSNGTDTIDGAASQVVPQWSCMEIIDYAANKWAII
jgi:hypothetical protein